MLLVYMNFILGRTRPFVIAGPPEAERRIALLRESAYPGVMRRGLGYPLKMARWKIPGTVEVLGREVTAIRALHDQVAMATSFRVRSGAHDLTFSGDTGWQDDLAELARGSDVFICECSTVTAEYWGHLSVAELTAHRDAIEVGQLVLTHMSAASRVEANRVADTLDVTVADDGLEIQLGGVPDATVIASTS